MTPQENQENIEQAERLYSEWLQVEEALDSAGIAHTIVFFGSARIEDKHTSEIMLENARKMAESSKDSELATKALRDAKLCVKQSRFYEDARELSKRIGQYMNDCSMNNTRLITGGGPGIMEAANRGASEIGRQSIGLNIDIPNEQRPNPYIREEYSFKFHYFSLRKMHFLKRAKVVIVFPGGYGTLDELMEILTLIQTRKISPIPIILFGEEFWSRIIDFEYLAEQQFVDTQALNLYTIIDAVDEAYQSVVECLGCE